MTPQIALAMLLLSNLALLVLYIHMEREIEKIKNKPINNSGYAEIDGIKLYDIRIDYDCRKQLYMLCGVVTKEDLREATRNDKKYTGVET